MSKIASQSAELIKTQTSSWQIKTPSQFPATAGERERKDETSNISSTKSKNRKAVGKHYEISEIRPPTGAPTWRGKSLAKEHYFEVYLCHIIDDDGKWSERSDGNLAGIAGATCLSVSNFISLNWWQLKNMLLLFLKIHKMAVDMWHKERKTLRNGTQREIF